MAALRDKLRRWQELAAWVNETMGANQTDNYASPFDESSLSIEKIFGTFFIVCGTLAALANLLILLAVVKHLKYRNALFVIISNFAVIDTFKAFCAIYMGASLLQVNVNRLHSDRYFLIFKMLQTSVLMMYFGNICSVFNLILATVNEYIYIRMPLNYRKVMARRRVVAAIVLTWLLALCFSVGKALHNDYSSSGILVALTSNGSGEANGTAAAAAAAATTTTTTTTTTSRAGEECGSCAEQTGLFALTGDGQTIKRVREDQQPTGTDVFTIILLACLLLCLIVVGLVYLALYSTIRRAQRFRKKARRAGLEETGTATTFCNPLVAPGSKITKLSMLTRRKELVCLMSNQQRCSPPIKATNESLRRSRNCNGQPVATITLSERKKARRNSRPKSLKRYKCILVILIVCLLHFVYLSIYLALQLLRIEHIGGRFAADSLQARYIINFTLRALFVVHAALNPLVFFRIRSFRVTFLKLFRSCFGRRKRRHSKRALNIENESRRQGNTRGGDSSCKQQMSLPPSPVLDSTTKYGNDSKVNTKLAAAGCGFVDIETSF